MALAEQSEVKVVKLLAVGRLPRKRKKEAKRHPA